MVDSNVINLLIWKIFLRATYEARTNAVAVLDS